MNTLSKTIKKYNVAIGNESILTSIKNRFAESSLYKAIKKGLDSIFKTMVIDKDQPEYDSSVIKNVSEIGYMALSKVTVFVPVNLNTNMNNYVSILGGNFDDLVHSINGLLDDTINMLGVLINTPDLLASAGFNTDKAKLTKYTATLDKLEKNMAECFDSRQKADKLPLRDVYPNIATMVSTARDIATLQTSINSSNIEHIKSRIATLYQIAEDLATEVRSNPEYEVVTAPIQALISDRLYVTARYVEMYGFMIQQCNVLIACVLDTNDKLADM